MLDDDLPLIRLGRALGTSTEGPRRRVRRRVVRQVVVVRPAVEPVPAPPAPPAPVPAEVLAAARDLIQTLGSDATTDVLDAAREAACARVAAHLIDLGRDLSARFPCPLRPRPAPRPLAA